jgi:WD40 repeat protein
VLSILAFNAQRTAQKQASIAQARELSQAAALNLDNDPELAILLSQQAIKAWQFADRDIPSDLAETLHKAVQNARVNQVWIVDGTALDIGFNRDTDDPYLILTDEDTSFVRVWDPIQNVGIFYLDDANISSQTILPDLSADGALIAIPHADNVARVYEVKTGDLMHELETDTTILIGTVFSPDGRLLGTFGKDYVGIWDLGTGELALPPYTDPTTDLLGFRLAFSQDGSRVVWSSPTNTTRVIDTGSGEVVAELTSEFNTHTSAVALSLDGNRVAINGLGESIQVWDLSEGRNPKPINIWHTALTQYSMLFNPSGDQIAYGMNNGVLIWDLTRDEVYLNLPKRLDFIRNLAYNQGGDKLLSYSADQKLVLWNLSPSHELEAIPVLDQDGQYFIASMSLDFHPDGSKIAVGESVIALDNLYQNKSKIMDTLTGDQLLELGSAEAGEFFGSVAFSPDGELLAIIQTNATLQIWDSHTGDLIHNLSDFGEELLHFAHDRGYRDMAISPLCVTSPGEICPLATAGTDGQAIIWDANSGEQIIKYQNEEALVSIAFSPDGKLLAFGNAPIVDLEKGGWVKLMDVDSGEILHKWDGITGWLFGLDFSSNGEQLAFGTTFGDFRVMDVDNKEEILKLESTSATVIIMLKYTPDGKYLITNGMESSAVWDAKTGERLYELAEHTGLPLGLAISPDGSKVAVGTDMIYQYFLDVEQLAALGQERLTRTFAEDECQKYLHLDECPGE